MFKNPVFGSRRLCVTFNERNSINWVLSPGKWLFSHNNCQWVWNLFNWYPLGHTTADSSFTNHGKRFDLFENQLIEILISLDLWSFSYHCDSPSWLYQISIPFHGHRNNKIDTEHVIGFVTSQFRINKAMNHFGRF